MWSVARHHGNTRQWALMDTYVVLPYLFFVFFILFKKYLFGSSRSWLHHVGSFSYGMGELAPWPKVEAGPPALGAQSFSHWTTREVLCLHSPYFYSHFSPHHPQSGQVLPLLQTSSNLTSSRKSLLITPQGGKVPGLSHSLLHPECLIPSLV